MPIVICPKGSPKVPGSGRKVGAANKLTRDLKALILEAADEAGGKGGARAYLAAQAKENPTQFLQLFGKLIPLSAEGELGAVVVNITRFASDGN